MAETTTRAYTLKLSGEGDWRDLLWQTHVAVNRGAWVWGDWLLTLRGGLPESLADEQTDRRVLLALSWLSVESPASLVPQQHIVACGSEETDDRKRKVMARFREILVRLAIPNPQQWIEACEPALTARIRDDAVWVDRSAAFAALRQRYPGLTSNWVADTLFAFLGGADEYFALPNSDTAVAPEAKDFVQKAGGWLSRNWGSGEKSDSSSIGASLTKLAAINAPTVVGKSGPEALATLLSELSAGTGAEDEPEKLLKQLKQTIGWKGRSSKGAIALEKIRDANAVSEELWQKTVTKLLEESTTQANKGSSSAAKPSWMQNWRVEMELALELPYRVDRDLIWEQGVMLDHALRRVSGAHSWIKRAEAERRRFREDAAKIDSVPANARDWLDQFCEERSGTSGGDYTIRKRAIDGWEKVVQAWAALGADATRRDRIAAARDVQSNLDDNDKFGDVQLFAGFGDDDDDDPQACLADDDAIRVWQTADGKADADILKHYVAARVAESDQQRFKVPAYRHPDPLRNPIYVDFGNSRWGIAYSALEATQGRVKIAEKLPQAKTDKAREKLRKQLEEPVDLRGVTLGVWNGQQVQSLALRWHGRRLWNDLDLDHFANSKNGNPVARADRLGRVVGGHSQRVAVEIAAVFEQKDWNGRLQVPRDQLDRLADLVYGKLNGKRVEPDYAKLNCIDSHPQAQSRWQRLRWFLTTSAKLQPQGPWLDYVAANLPEGIAYKKGRTEYYLEYQANKGRKGKARLQLARLPGLRVLSLDLGHRYAAACAVWETLSLANFAKEIDGREIVHGGTTERDLYCHTSHADSQGKRRTTIYRRIGADKLDGSRHPAPWARLDRQFLIKLQGEDRPARRASQLEIDSANAFRAFLGLPALAENLRIDDLQKDTVRVARLGLRRLGDMARIAFAMTAAKKPISGGREIDLTPQQRMVFLLDALILWQGLADGRQYQDTWIRDNWREWVVGKFGGPQAVEISDEVPRSQRRKKIDATRGPLDPIAQRLADPNSAEANQLHGLWVEEWSRRQAEWHKHLRWVRRFVLPRKRDVAHDLKKLRGLGGLGVQRLQTIRELYQVLKAFRMRPEPDDLRKNVPAPGDESLARFGRRILNQLERMREQRIKQLASRIVEGALGVGRMCKSQGRDRKRPQQRVDPPCHAVVIENLENYKPEDSRLRRENRQLMNWAARNVRKYIMEGCQLHGLYFDEVSPTYTSRQDSRTGAPGIRCEDVSRRVLEEAVRRAAADGSTEMPISSSSTRFERDVRRWARELRRIGQPEKSADLKPWQHVLADVARSLANLPESVSVIRLPRRGGEVFVSSLPGTKRTWGTQADLNAAANIGLKVLFDPDWIGAWWFVLVNVASGKVVEEKVAGSAVWSQNLQLWPARDTADMPAPNKAGQRGGQSTAGTKPNGYAFNPLFSPEQVNANWTTAKPYWEAIEKLIAEHLCRKQNEVENPF